MCVLWKVKGGKHWQVNRKVSGGGECCDEIKARGVGRVGAVWKGESSALAGKTQATTGEEGRNGKEGSVAGDKWQES